MVFKITVARQPFAVEFETGSVSEAIGVLQSEGTEFAKLFDINFGGQGETPQGDAGTATEAPKARRGRKPAEASAPPPMPAPGAAPSPPTPPNALNTAENANGIPSFLDRTATAAPPPPPAMPSAPPIAPPVSGPVGIKVIAELDKRAAGSLDNGKSLADWLGQAGLIVPGATYPEAVSVLRMTTDDKLAGVAAALGV
jgi:hypothetical protein